MRLRDRIASRYLYTKIRIAMSVSDAKEILGFPPSAHPSEDEIAKAYKAKAFENHPDRGGDPTKMVEINVARDVLQGSPASKHSPESDKPSTSTRTRWEPPPPEKIVTFDEAKSKGGVPSGTKWLFVTEAQYSGYSSDEFANNASGWVAVGETDESWVFTSVEYHRQEDMFIGAKKGKTEEYIVRTETLKKSPPTAALFYGKIMQMWKGFKYVDKRFNSKVVPAEGWVFSSNRPNGRSMSIKNFLENTGLVEETEGTPKKYVVQVTYLAASSLDKNPDTSKYYKDRYDAWALNMTVNGKEYPVPVRALERLAKARFQGKSFLNWLFGDYYHPGTTKTLSQKKGVGPVAKWMAENLDLADWVTKALVALGEKK